MNPITTLLPPRSLFFGRNEYLASLPLARAIPKHFNIHWQYKQSLWWFGVSHPFEWDSSTAKDG